ncbi:ribonuclease P protein component [bacterium]|nr:ribonuclease P protein component [bacterium]
MGLDTLRGRSNFKRLFTSGRAKSSGAFTVYRSLNGLDANRYGIAVKTSAGGAVVRNRIKRWLRVLLAEWDGALASGFDVVVLARGTGAAESYQAAAHHLAKALRKAELADNELGH